MAKQQDDGYPQEGKGGLFKNDFKEHSKHPDFTGSIRWNGEKIELGGWKSETKAGDPYLSIKLQEPYNGGSKSSGPKNPPKEKNPFD